jgi:hypothetical protein
MSDPITSPSSVPDIDVSGRQLPPSWAVRQRDLIQRMDAAAIPFTKHATRSDGTLRQYTKWCSMDGTDNGYEAFLSFSLFYLLGGGEQVHTTARREWEAITWQYTNYGTMEREFPIGFDWFHHSESYTYLSYLALANPGHHVDRVRALRFANMYTGADPQAPNWDADKRMIRGPLNGSRGPRLVTTEQDWRFHRPLLSDYLSPFEDIDGVDTSDPLFKVDWTDDAMFKQILTRFNERMTRIDVPLNMSAAMLVTHAYLFTGQDRFRQWVLDYLQVWEEHCHANGGIVPDNIGPGGTVGELNGGQWWGGYYGWRWPHGARNIVESALVAGSCALLMTGDRSHLDLCRSQLDLLWEQRKIVNGKIMVPARYGGQGWFDYREPAPLYYIHLYYLSQSDEDLARLDERFPDRVGFENLPPVWGRGKAGPCPPTAWLKFNEGHHPDYPDAILDSTFDNICGAMDRIDTDDEDREHLHCSHYQRLNPVVSEGIVQMAMGTPAALYNGGLLQTHLFYYDPLRRRPGLPEHVSALADKVTDNGVRVHLVNTDPVAGHAVLLQSGAFGEHRFVGARLQRDGKTDNMSVAGKHLRVYLGPAAQVILELKLERYASAPSYALPDFDA